jgi:hypothetical protein
MNYLMEMNMRLKVNRKLWGQKIKSCLQCVHAYVQSYDDWDTLQEQEDVEMRICVECRKNIPLVRELWPVVIDVSAGYAMDNYPQCVEKTLFKAWNEESWCSHYELEEKWYNKIF